MNYKFFKILIVSTIFLLITKISYSQCEIDSLRNVLVIWNLPDNFTKQNVELEDSSIINFHIFEKEKKNSILNSNLGNLGSANISDIYIKRNDSFDNDFIFNTPYYLYIKNSKNIRYYNTRRPFTSAMHSTSFKKNNIQTLRFIHSQNINPYFNVTADFDYTTSLGSFISQKTSLNTTTISLNYKKEKYFIYASYARNKVENENSGGYIDTIGSDIVIPEGFLSKVKFIVKNQELSATQFYKFGDYKAISYKDTVINVLKPKTSLSHNINVYRKYRVYTDIEKAGSKLPNANFFYQEGISMDSISITGMSNKFRYGSEESFEEKNKYSFSIVLEADLKKYYNFKEYIFLGNNKTILENNISGKIASNNFMDIKSSFFAKYYMSGYRRNDFKFQFSFQKKYNLIDFSLKTNTAYFKPNYFEQVFYSNHYKWENDFSATKKVDVVLKANVDKYNTKITLANSLINNHIYFGTLSQPVQYDSTIFISTAGLENELKLGNFIFSTKIYWQNSSKKNIISLPKLALYNSTLYRFDLKSNSSFLLGYEVYFSTTYKAKSFNSSIGKFYQENLDAPVIGNYPFVSLFLNMKIKKNVMLSFKYDHINYKMMSVQNPLQINHYPVYGRVFRFAVRWTFNN